MPQYGHESGKQNAAGNSVVVIEDEDGDVLEINADGSITATLLNKVCTNNSTTAQLLADGVFTGAAGAMNGYASILITVYTDVASATDGLSIQFSHTADPYDWHESDAYTIAAGAYKTFTLQPVDAYFRVVYTNGGSDTSELHINVQLHSVAPKASSHRMEDDISGQDDAQLVKSIIAAERSSPAGVYTNIQATNGGNLKISVEEFDAALVNGDGFQIVSNLPAALEIPEGEITGHYAVNKFGRCTNADAADPTDIWDRANATNDQAIWLAPTAARVHAIASTSDNDGKTGAPSSTGARTVQVYGLKTWDLAETSEVVTLDGTTAVNTANSYVIIHRIKVLTSGASGPNIGTITATAATDATVTAQIQPLEGQTQMAIYGIPSTQKAFMTGFYGSLERDSPTGASALLKLIWCFDVENQPTVFQVKHTVTITSGQPSHRHEYNPYNGFTGPGIFKLQVNSDGNDTLADGGFDLILVDN